jgi:hypothetical protein
VIEVGLALFEASALNLELEGEAIAFLDDSVPDCGLVGLDPNPQLDFCKGDKRVDSRHCRRLEAQPDVQLGQSHNNER